MAQATGQVVLVSASPATQWSTFGFRVLVYKTTSDGTNPGGTLVDVSMTPAEVAQDDVHYKALLEDRVLAAAIAAGYLAAGDVVRVTGAL